MLELEEADGSFVRRHNGPSAVDIAAMLAAVGAEGLEQLIAETVPERIRMATELELYPSMNCFSDSSFSTSPTRLTRREVGRSTYSHTAEASTTFPTCLARLEWHQSIGSHINISASSCSAGPIVLEVDRSIYSFPVAVTSTSPTCLARLAWHQSIGSQKRPSGSN